MKILLTISYDGTNYVGWQTQINGISVQKTLENALEKLYHKKIQITGASRTDSGVHAVCQKATYEVDINHYPIDKLPVILNGHLPEDIAVILAEEVPSTFHPRYNAKQKTYRYLIHNAKVYDPLCRLTSWHVLHPLDVELMNEASKHFIGTHDFKGFCSTGSIVKSTVRTIHDMNVSKHGDIIEITITGNGFLYNMVRIIVGTLHEVGLGKIKPEQIEGIIKSGIRANAGKTAPPQGLCLMDIRY